MTLRELDTVVLLRDLPAHDLRRGDLGAIASVLAPTLFTVEFVRVSGHTHARADEDGTDNRAMKGTDIPSVRGARRESCRSLDVRREAQRRGKNRVGIGKHAAIARLRDP